MKTLQLAALIAVMALGIMQTRADQTNLVQNVNLRLFGSKQGATTTNRSVVVTSVDTVRIDTRQIIRALAAATANTFSSTSRLVLVTPLNGNSPAVQVRDGANVVDVSSFFAIEQIGISVTSSAHNTRTGTSIQNTYSIRHLLLQDADGYPVAVHLDVRGLATQTTAIARQRSVENLNVDVTGTGDRDGDQLLIQGTISIIGNELEVVVDNGVPT